MTPVGEDIIIRNTVGKTYIFTPSEVFITLGVGWAAFGLALIFNFLYYVLHPLSAGLFSLTWFSFTNLLKVNVTNIKEKLVVRVFGYVFTAMKEEEKAEEAEEKLNVAGD